MRGTWTAALATGAACLVAGAVAGAAGASGRFASLKCLGTTLNFVVNGNTLHTGKMAPLPNGRRAGIVYCGRALYVPLQVLYAVIDGLGGSGNWSPGKTVLSINAAPPPAASSTDSGSPPAAAPSAGGSINSDASCGPVAGAAWRYTNCAVWVDDSGTLWVTGSLTNISANPETISFLSLGLYDASGNVVDVQQYPCDAAGCPATAATLQPGESAGYKISYPNVPASATKYEVDVNQSPLQTSG